jgi:hypothetical protein
MGRLGHVQGGINAFELIEGIHNMAFQIGWDPMIEIDSLARLRRAIFPDILRANSLLGARQVTHIPTIGGGFHPKCELF